MDTKIYCSRCAAIGETCLACWEMLADGEVAQPNVWGNPVVTAGDWARETGADQDEDYDE